MSGHDSEVDGRDNYLPSADLHRFLRGVAKQIEENDTQEAYGELQKFSSFALKANGNILKCLYGLIVENAIRLKPK